MDKGTLMDKVEKVRDMAEEMKKELDSFKLLENRVLLGAFHDQVYEQAQIEERQKIKILLASFNMKKAVEIIEGYEVSKIKFED